MRQTAWLVLAVLALGCDKAAGPVISMDREALAGVRKLAIVPVQNATEYQSVNPLAEQLFLQELVGIERYEYLEPDTVEAAMAELGYTADDLGNPFKVKNLGKRVGADAVVGIMVTTYVPFASDVVRSGKKESRATEKPPQPKGLLGLLVPDQVSVSRTEIEYASVTRDPSLGAIVYVIEAERGTVIYNASKFISAKSRIPGTYSQTYGEMLRPEEAAQVSTIGRLVMKELLEPLREEL